MDISEFLSLLHEHAVVILLNGFKTRNIQPGSKFSIVFTSLMLLTPCILSLLSLFTLKCNPKVNVMLSLTTENVTHEEKQVFIQLS